MRTFKTKPTGRPRSLAPETEQQICNEARTNPLFSFAEVGRRHGTTEGTVRATLVRYGVPFPPKRYNLYSFPTTRYWKARNSALKRGLDFTVTMADLEELFQKQGQLCPYTGWKLTFPAKSDSYDGTASLDRINSTKGYVEGNVQWVHKHINLMKLAHTHEEFVELCKAVAHHSGSMEPNHEVVERLLVKPGFCTNKWHKQHRVSAAAQSAPSQGPARVCDTSLQSDGQ